MAGIRQEINSGLRSSNNTSNTGYFGSDIGSDSTVIVVVMDTDSDFDTGAHPSGAYWSRIADASARRSFSGSYVQTSHWYCDPGDFSGNSITVDRGSSAYAWYAYELDGEFTNVANDKFSSGSSGSIPLTADGASSGSDSVAIASARISADRSGWSIDDSFTLDDTISYGYGNVAHRLLTSATTAAPTFSYDSFGQRSGALSVWDKVAASGVQRSIAHRGGLVVPSTGQVAVAG